MIKYIKLLFIFCVALISCANSGHPKKYSLVNSSSYYTSGVLLRGVNIAGAEYGDDWDGWTGQSYYTWRTPSALSAEMSYFGGKGMNIFRLPLSWERLQHTLNGPFDATYQTNMVTYVNQATASGWTVIIDLHNYNRYAVNAFSGTSQTTSYTIHKMGDGTLSIDNLCDVWAKLATLFAYNNNVMFNIMNEPHDFPMTSTDWFSGIQRVINTIRATGAKQLILVPNSRGSDVTHWSSYAPNGGPLDSVAALAVTDSVNNFAFDMHAYDDNPPSSSDYSTLISNVTNWATANNRKLFLSELGSVQGATNGAAAISGLMNYLNSHNNVWVGWTAWNLAPYNITVNGVYTTDGPSMAWYSPFLIPNTVSGTSPTPIVDSSVDSNLGDTSTVDASTVDSSVVDSGVMDAGSTTPVFYARRMVYNQGSTWTCMYFYVKNVASVTRNWSLMYVNAQDSKLTSWWSMKTGQLVGATGSIKFAPVDVAAIPAYTEKKVGGACFDFGPLKQVPSVSGIN